MKRLLLFTVAGLVLVSFVVLSPKTAKASGGYVTNLWGVTVVAKDNIWAVGSANALTSEQTLIEHFHNHVWQIVPSPNPLGSIVSELFGVASRPHDDDVWAVGTSGQAGQVFQPLIERWDGTQWQIVSSPSLPNGGVLSAVTVLSDDNAWAVGGAPDQTLIEHWDGKTWQIVPSQKDAPSASLDGITYTSKNNVWVVGTATDSSQIGHAIIEHWDGKAWSVIPNPAPTNSFLQGVTATSHEDIWAVGYSRDSQGVESTLTEHWNGQTWQIVASVDPASSPILRLMGVTAISSNDVWAAGFFRDTDGIEKTLTEHWDGDEWKIVSSPTPSSPSEIEAVAAASQKEVWMVGALFPTSGSFTLTEHWDGRAWSIVSSPNP